MACLYLDLTYLAMLEKYLWRSEVLLFSSNDDGGLQENALWGDMGALYRGNQGSCGPINP
jgi:hypothetical protein